MFDGLTQSLEKQAAEAIAAKMGIDPSMADMAIGALTRNHSIPGDTVQQSAQQTGLPTDMLSQILGQIGGEGGLGALVGAMGGGAGGTAGQGQASTAQAAPEGGLGGILAGLGGLSGIAKMIDRDGDGNPLDEIAAMLGRK